MSQDTRVYRIQFLDIEISRFGSLLKPGVLYQTDRETLSDKKIKVLQSLHVRRGLT